MKTTSKALVAVRELWLPIALVAVWWIVSASSTNIYFPPLSEIMSRFADIWVFDGVVPHVLPSLRNWSVGVLIAAVLGIAFGMLAGLVPIIADITRPLTEFFRAVPGLALVPLALMVFGLGPAMAIPLVVYGAFWPIYLNTVDGVRSMEPLVRDARQVFRIRRIDFLFRIALPTAAPQLVVGIRQALSIGISVIFFSEMVGATEGIGYVTRYAERTFATADMWAGIILLGIIGYVVNLIFHLVESKVLAWHYSSKNTK